MKYLLIVLLAASFGVSASNNQSGGCTGNCSGGNDGGSPVEVVTTNKSKSISDASSNSKSVSDSSAVSGDSRSKAISGDSKSKAIAGDSTSNAQAGDSYASTGDSSATGGDSSASTGDSQAVGGDTTVISTYEDAYEAVAHTVELNLAYCSDGSAGSSKSGSISLGGVAFTCEVAMVIPLVMSTIPIELAAAKRCNGDAECEAPYLLAVDETFVRVREMTDDAFDYINMRGNTAGVGSSFRDLLPIIGALLLL